MERGEFVRVVMEMHAKVGELSASPLSPTCGLIPCCTPILEIA